MRQQNHSLNLNALLNPKTQTLNREPNFKKQNPIPYPVTQTITSKTFTPDRSAWVFRRFELIG